MKKDWFAGGVDANEQGASGHASLLGLSDDTGTGGVGNVFGTVGTTPNAGGGSTSGVSVGGSAVDAQFTDGTGVTMLGGKATAGTTTDGKGNSSTGLSFDGSFMNGHDKSANADVGNVNLFAGTEQNADGSGFAGAKGAGGIMHSTMDNGTVVDIGEVTGSAGRTTNADGSTFDGFDASASGLEVTGAGGAGMQVLGADIHSGTQTDANGNQSMVVQGGGSVFQMDTGDTWDHGSVSGKALSVDVDAKADANHEQVGLDVTPIQIAGSFDAKNEEHQTGGASFGDDLASFDAGIQHGDSNGDGLKEYGANVSTDLLATKLGIGAQYRTGDSNGDGVDEHGVSLNAGPLDVNLGAMGDPDGDGLMETGGNVKAKILGMPMGLGYTSKSGDTNGDGVEETGFGLDLGPLGIDTGDTNHDGKSDFAAHLGPLGTQIGDTDGDGQTDYNMTAGLGGFKANYSTEDPVGDLAEVLNPFDAPGHDDKHNTTQSVIDTAGAVKDTVVGGAKSVANTIGNGAKSVANTVGNAAKGLGSMASGLWGRFTGK